MPKEPDVPPDLIREALTSGPDGTRPTSTQAAKWLADKINKPVRPDLVRQALQRHGWDDVAEGQPGRPRLPANAYEVEAALGPVDHAHKTSHHWLKLTTYERVQDGRAKDGEFARRSVAYVETRKREHTVADYGPGRGFWVRPAWPWEVGCYYRQPVPEDGRSTVELAVGAKRDGESAVADWVTEEHLTYWKTHLDELP